MSGRFYYGLYIEYTPQFETEMVDVRRCPFDHPDQHSVFCGICSERLQYTKEERKYPQPFREVWDDDEITVLPYEDVNLLIPTLKYSGYGRYLDEDTEMGVVVLLKHTVGFFKSQHKELLAVLEEVKQQGTIVRVRIGILHW